MYEFNLDQEPEEMSEEDAKATLADFMERHEDNVEEHQDLQDKLAAFTETVESADDVEEIVGQHEGIKAHFAQDLSGYVEERTGMTFSDEEIASKFDLPRILELNEERKQFTEENPEGEDGTGEDPGETTFEDKPQKSTFNDGTEASERARADMQKILGGGL